MPQQLLSPEIQAFATGFPLTLMHGNLSDNGLGANMRGVQAVSSS